MDALFRRRLVVGDVVEVVGWLVIIGGGGL
jgi:hypothetical protein